MQHSDQDSWAAPHGTHRGAAPYIDRASGPIAALAREIEDTQRRQTETITHIVERLRSLDVNRPKTPAAAPRQTSGPDLGDELWDADSAEALTRLYEADASLGSASAEPQTGTDQDWLGGRFNDLTQRIKSTLSDLKPGSAMASVEARLDQFQKHIAFALEDVVRRSDLAGLHLIETHVNDLGDKLEHLERHVARVDYIEADVRSVMEQVSDERIAKLLDYDSRFAADLEAVAKRAVEEAHARFGDDADRVHEDTRRHDELRHLIESSLLDRRQSEASTSSLVAGLSGNVNAQTDRFEEMRSLLEMAIGEQRQNEQTAFGMLDTLQQALVRVLDRVEAIEAHQLKAPAWANAEAASWTDGEMMRHPEPEPEPFYDEPSPDAHRVSPALGSNEPMGSYVPMAYEPPAREPFVAFGAADSDMDAEVPAREGFSFGGDAPVETNFETTVAETPEEDAGTTIEKLRRDFIADARRAKMKAAANRAEAVSHHAEPGRAASALEPTRAMLAKAARAPIAGAGRLFGASPKLLAGALALVVAINGGILLFSRKGGHDGPAVPAATAPESTRPSSPLPSGTQPAEPNPGPRTDLGPEGAADDVHTAAPAAGPAPYGLFDDVLNPPSVDISPSSAAAVAPRGMLVAANASMPADVQADIYREQLQAGLSGQLGAIAAGQSANAMLPDANGRIDTAYSPVVVAPAQDDNSQRAGALDLPPPTVGPLSLRLAAANGDASAEFEVAARMAEGKGTNQNFAEAIRWYQRSAAKGFAQAQYRLGTLYERGLGAKKDIGRAKVWYQRAAEQGNIKSMHNLAVLTAGGDQGEPDYAAATQWFSKAAEHGLSDSQYNLGVLYENGLGVKASSVTAYKWYALAARGGDADATARLDAVKGTLSADDLKLADGLVASFKARSANVMANDARAAGEDWKKRVNNNTNG